MVAELSAPELVEESKYWRTNSAAKIGKNIEAQMKMRKMMKKCIFLRNQINYGIKTLFLPKIIFPKYEICR